VIVTQKAAKLTFYYRTNREPHTIEMPLYELNRNIERFIHRRGVFRFGDTKINLSVVNRINIEFFMNDYIY